MSGTRTLKATSALLLALGLGVSACGGDQVGPGEWTIDDLVGTWAITQIEYTSDTDDDTFDVISGGTTGTMVINGNGNYEMTLRAPGPIVSTTTGTFTIDNNGNVVDSNEAGSVDITRDGDRITIRDESVTFDFDDDPGTPEEAADLEM